MRNGHAACVAMLIVGATAASGCGDSATDESSTTVGGNGTSSTTGGGGAGGETATSGGGAASCDIPTVADLEAFFAAGGYTDWSAESSVHVSLGPHFGDARVFVNDILFDSLTAGATSHPRCAATVKELYGDGDTILGYSYWLKVDDADGGDSIYWYERYNSTTFASETGDATCVGCHSGGVDFFNTGFPLR